jgi:hypothetical protein
MKIRTIRSEPPFFDIRKILRAEATEDPAFRDQVAGIISQVAKGGDGALLDFTARFDEYAVREVIDLRIGPAAMEEAASSLEPRLIAALHAAAENIRAFHTRQLERGFLDFHPDGTVLGQRVLPLARVGIYVPGGQAAYPSSVLMNAIPARVAGVDRVVMAYTDRLYASADWFRQLWAESLGKRLDRDGQPVFRGPTPVKALGVTDQHSQVQLYIEGPFDKTITFLSVRDLADPLPIPRSDIEELAYLGGHSLGELLAAERIATTQALTEHGRMNMTIELPRLSAFHFGELLMLLQIATIYAGGLYHVDPLDQPGVELGKELTYGLMGRPGYEARRAPAPDPRWQLA